MKILGFSKSLRVALCKGTKVQNLTNSLQRKIVCSAQSEELKFVSCVAEVTVKCCVPSTSMSVDGTHHVSGVTDGTVRISLLNVESLFCAMVLWSSGCFLGAGPFFDLGRCFLWRWAMLFPIPTNCLKRSQRIWGTDVDELQRWRWNNGKWWCLTL